MRTAAVERSSRDGFAAGQGSHLQDFPVVQTSTLQGRSKCHPRTTHMQVLLCFSCVTCTVTCSQASCCCAFRPAGHQLAAAGCRKLWQRDAADGGACVPNRGRHIPGQHTHGWSCQAAACWAQHKVRFGGCVACGADVGLAYPSVGMLFDTLPVPFGHGCWIVASLTLHRCIGKFKA